MRATSRHHADVFSHLPALLMRALDTAEVAHVLDELDPTRVEQREAAAVQPAPVPVQPQAPAPADEDDDELAAYNRHLAWLAAQAQAKQ